VFNFKFFIILEERSDQVSSTTKFIGTVDADVNNGNKRPIYSAKI